MATERPTTGDNIAAEMKRRRLSQATLAGHLGLTQAAVSARLRGNVDWRLAELLTVASVLSVPLTVLLPAEAAPTEAGVA